MTRERKSAGSIPKMASLSIMVALLLALGFGTAVCLAAGPEQESGVWGSDSGWTLWAFPPAVEYADSAYGYRSFEIGLTPALWASGDGLDSSLGLRLGAFWYPSGGWSGPALYAGFTQGSTEVGLWYVWRPRPSTHSSGDTPTMSFRIGIGSVGGRGSDGTSPGQFGLGVGVGFMFY